MKAVNWFFVILFVISALLQYNDPDPYIWIPLYLYGALLCWQATLRIYRQLLYVIGVLAYSLYAAYLFFDTTGVLSWYYEHDAENIAQSMKATKPWIEETREFFGLLLLILALVMNMIWLRNKKVAQATSLQSATVDG
ncbi:MAG TPA: transmembrane 220 family protein [Flavisolibacter sp.]|nr:transmembrane 220 family protein [Flavisolibacter sp.]